MGIVLILVAFALVTPIAPVAHAGSRFGDTFKEPEEPNPTAMEQAPDIEPEPSSFDAGAGAGAGNEDPKPSDFVPHDDPEDPEPGK